MAQSVVPDPNDWRTWERDGIRLFPPNGATSHQAFVGWQAYCLAHWGVDPEKPLKDRRNVAGVQRQVDGKYVMVRFARVVSGKPIDVRVRGGCRIIPRALEHE
jgi:hypothetical protein